MKKCINCNNELVITTQPHKKFCNHKCRQQYKRKLIKTSCNETSCNETSDIDWENWYPKSSRSLVKDEIVDKDYGDGDEIPGIVEIIE